MTPTPSQMELWANGIVRDCLLCCGGDVGAGLAAAELILSTQPIPLSIDEEGNEHKAKGTPDGGQFTGKNDGKTDENKPIQRARKARRVKITLAEIAGEVGDYVDEAQPLKPGNADPIIVEKSQGDKYYIVDGFHRAAGILKWARQNRIKSENIKIIVVRSDDKKLTRKAAEPGKGQEAAIRKIYRHAGIDLSLSAFFAYDIHNRHAQGILNRTLKAAKGLTDNARKDLIVALKDSATDSGQAILEFIDKYRLQLAKLLTTTQLASLLEGAREVSAKVPALEEDAKAIGPVPQPTFPKQDGIHLVTIEEAAKQLGEKNVLTRDSFDALEAAARAKAFTVAGVDASDTLEKIRDVLSKNVKEGADYETFKSQVMAAVDEGTFLSDAHTETVFRTNVQGAFSDGQMAVLQNPFVRSGFPYSAYDSIHDDRVRPEHLSLDKHGIDGSNVYRTDDPVFQTFRPPWDYNCRCSWTPITVRQASEAGVKEAKEWLDTGVEPSPPHFVAMPPFEPPPGFQRALTDAPLSIRLSMQPMAAFAHDVSGEKRDDSGKWTEGGSNKRGKSKTTNVKKLSQNYKKFYEGEGQDIIDLDEVEPHLKTSNAGFAAIAAFTTGSYSEINGNPNHPASKAMLDLVRKLPDTDAYSLTRVMAFANNSDRKKFLAKLGKPGDVYTQDRTFASWNDAEQGTGQGEDIVDQYGKYKVILQLDDPLGAKDITLITGRDESEGGEILTLLGSKHRITSVEKEDRNYTVTMESVQSSALSIKEGDKPEEQTDTALLYGASEGAGPTTMAALDTAKEPPNRKPAHGKYGKGKSSKARRRLFKRLRVKKKWATVSLSTDSEGHEHKGKGKGGGQFTGKGHGGGGSTGGTVAQSGPQVVVSPANKLRKAITAPAIPDSTSKANGGNRTEANSPVSKQGWRDWLGLSKKKINPTVAYVEPQLESLSPKHQLGISRFTKLMDRQKLPDEMKTAYTKAVIRVVSSMPENAVTIITKTMLGTKFHSNVKEVTADFVKTTGEKLDKYTKIYGFWSSLDRKLTVDGLEKHSGGGEVFNEEENIHANYAHEMTHILDCQTINPRTNKWEYKFSGTPEWKQAYEKEIVGDKRSNPRLSEYARTMSSEGFAEFGRALYGSDAPREEVAKHFPMCYAFFQKNGLVD